MVRDSLVLVQTQKEADQLEKSNDKVEISERNRRSTRSSHGFIQSKQFDNVIDWSQRRSPVKEDKRVKRKAKKEEGDVQQETFISLEVSPLKEQMIPVVKRGPGRPRKKMYEDSMENKAKSSPLQQQSSTMQQVRKFTSNDCKNGSSSLHSDDITCLSQASSSESEKREIKVSLNMLVEEHRKVEVALKSLGKLLNSYQAKECIANDATSSSEFRNSSQYQKNKPFQESEAVVPEYATASKYKFDVQDGICDEEAAMTRDERRQEDKAALPLQS